ncbi:hypothetical protein [Cerasicoccus arenae]|nr:hypothetical protein [Cerasicoccus arenae]MBK1859866.1 hypothetical protein [Cerasicoccus arenae]
MTPHKNRKGFALIIAIALMSFIVLLMLSVSMLVRIETQLATQSQSVQAARQISLLGLYTALGEIQSMLGPDQRISTTADLVETLPTERSHWTGVWRTDTDAIDYSNAPKWLISTPSGNTSGAVSDIIIPEDAKIEMTPPYAAEDSGELLPAVVVGKISTGQGAYAYWVSDEGVKARVSLSQNSDVADAERSSFDSVVPEHFGINVIDVLEQIDIASNAKLERITNLSELPLIADDGSLLDESKIHALSPSLTGFSQSVLADVKNGGLKKDLTAGLQSSSIEPSGQMFGPQMSDTPTARDPGGPDWNQLRSYYNLRPNDDGRIEVREQLDDQMGVYPVLAGMQLYTFVTYQWVNRGTSDERADIMCHFLPAVVLWNPYSYPLESENYTVHFGRLKWQEGQQVGVPDEDDIWHPYNLYFEKAYSNNYRVYRLRSVDENGNEVYDPDDATAWFPGWDSLSFEINNVSFEPGEAKIFSPPAWHSPYQRNAQPSPIGENDSMLNDPNVLEEGMRLGASFYRRSVWQALHKDEEGNLLTRVKPAMPQYKDYAWRLARKSTGTPYEGEPLQVVMTLNPATISGVSPPPLNIDEFNPDIPLTRIDEFYGYKTVMNFTDNQLPSSPYNIPAWLGSYNPRATYSGSSQFEWPSGSLLEDAYMHANPSVNPSYLSYMDTLETEVDYEVVQTPQGSAFVGFSESNGPTKTILFDLPESEQHMASIAQLAHANLSNFFRVEDDPQSVFTRSVFRNARFQNLTPAYCIGNSLANPRIPRDHLFQSFADFGPSHANLRDFNFRGTLYDYPYLLNDVLWDHYFFSTVPRLGFDLTSKLPNSRLVLNEPSNPTLQELLDYDKASSHLMLNGGFNVNSTSVDAWAALLASFLGVPMQEQSDDFQALADDQAAYPRGQRVWGDGFDRAADDSRSDVVYSGYRTLNSEEIQALAEAIVKQIKMRGPFRSMSEFVNRSLSTNKPEQWVESPDDSAFGWNQKGALQAAIDEVSMDAAKSGKNLLNASFYDTYYMTQKANYVAGELPFPEAEVMPRAAGTPGFFTQYDLLYRLGSVLVARSDTFIIRAYGESQDPLTGKTEASAWCEAVVQRYPEYLDDEADPSAEADPVLSVNQQFGRGFRIVEFRWLNPSGSTPPTL